MKTINTLDTQAYIAVIGVPCPIHPLAADADAMATTWQPLGFYTSEQQARAAIHAAKRKQDVVLSTILGASKDKEAYDRMAALLADMGKQETGTAFNRRLTKWREAAVHVGNVLADLHGKIQADLQSSNASRSKASYSLAYRMAQKAALKPADSLNEDAGHE